MDMSIHTDSDADHEARHESRHEDGKGEFDPIAAEAVVAASEPPPQAAGAGEEEEGAEWVRVWAGVWAGGQDQAVQAVRRAGDHYFRAHTQSEEADAGAAAGADRTRWPMATKALASWRRAAELGDAEAHYNLGWAAQVGWATGVRNLSEAINLFGRVIQLSGGNGVGRGRRGSCGERIRLASARAWR